jgi:hypothetical protein
MPHYSIKGMFVSTGLIASGVMGLIAIERWMPVAKGLQAIPLLVLYYAAFVLLGTGIMLPFKKLSLGVSVGTVMAIVLVPYFFTDK